MRETKVKATGNVSACCTKNLSANARSICQGEQKGDTQSDDGSHPVYDDMYVVLEESEGRDNTLQLGPAST
jgi:hypothetical protein